MRIPIAELVQVMREILIHLDMEPDRATACATLFAESSADGVASHGLNRFPRFVATIRNGCVDVHAHPERVAAHGALERWNGHRGPGNLTAAACMTRAIALAREHGVGAVALANTNHWMRGGSYGWQAAEAGVIGICWTNTLANLPPWGTTVPLVGNNPLVIAVPRPHGHVVLDMAMSQFSYGAIASYRSRGEQLPVVGGFDPRGELTRDPASIEESGRALPIGFWKGSGLALLLDIVAALLSGGRATHEISTIPEQETGLSQVFLAFDARTVGSLVAMDTVVDQVVSHLHEGAASAGEQARYPGERAIEARLRSRAEGVLVDEAVWREVKSLTRD